MCPFAISSLQNYGQGLHCALSLFISTELCSLQNSLFTTQLSPDQTIFSRGIHTITGAVVDKPLLIGEKTQAFFESGGQTRMY